MRFIEFRNGGCMEKDLELLEQELAKDWQSSLKKQYALTTDEADYVNAWLETRGLPANINVTFGDVALPEMYSEVRSRSEIDDFAVELAGIELEMPVILANMACVAGANAIVSIERHGGLGIPPQMLSLKERLEILERVGRAQCALIDKPLAIGPNKTLGQAKQLMQKFGIYGLVVVDNDYRPIGILSTRDWRYEKDDGRLVGDLMGGKRKLYKARRNISFEDARKILRKHRIEKLPLVGRNGRLAGLITAHGLFYKNHHPNATRDANGRFLKVGSIGVGRHFTKERLYEVEAQMRKGICMLLIDTARAFSVNVKDAVIAVKKRYPKLPLMVGNVSTPEGAKALFEWGADIIKVGQGPGDACRTREIGIGIPQLSAVAKCAAIVKQDAPAAMSANGPVRVGSVVADGGIKNAGDVCKALIAGADAIMSGRLFIGTEESSGQAYFNKQGLRVKDYIGSASFHAQQERLKQETLDRERRPEGIKEEVPVTGTVRDVMDDLRNGMRSAMSYMGVTSVQEMTLKGKFQIQTSAGLVEGIKKK